MSDIIPDLLKHNHKIYKINQTDKFELSSNVYQTRSISKYYNFPVPNSSIAPTVAIVSFGGTFYTNLITSYVKAYSNGSVNLPSNYTPNITPVLVGVTSLTPSYLNMDVENMLDICHILGVNPYAKIRFYSASNTFGGFINVLAQIENDVSAHNISLVSISWGFSELGNQSSITTLDTYFNKISNLGVIIFASSGDGGSSDGTGQYTVDYPSSSNYIISCGGSSLASSPETTWSYNKTSNWGGGGGISSIFKIGSLQESVISKYVGVQVGRCVPDLALNADPNSGYTIQTQTQTGAVNTITVGGTSAVAPLLCGLFSIINLPSSRLKITPLSTLLYNIYPSNSKYLAFNDVTTGDNDSLVQNGSHYKAGTGYDMCTGLGTINGINLQKAF